MKGDKPLPESMLTVITNAIWHLISIQENAFKNVICKLSILSRPHWVKWTGGCLSMELHCEHSWALYYYNDLTSQSFQPMAAQLSMKAALPLAKSLVTASYRHSNTGPCIPPFQTHSQEELDAWSLVRVSEHFRVIALGLPVPTYQGNPLDPPLRSRFQARTVQALPYQDQLEMLQASVAGVPPET